MLLNGSSSGSKLLAKGRLEQRCGARRGRGWSRLCLAGALLGVLAPGLCTVLPAQNLNGSLKTAKHVRIAEPYGPPYEKQIKSLLEAGKVVLLSGGKSQFSEGVTLRIFSETNTPLQFIQLQECVYNSAARTVESSGPIRMETADGKFAIEGIGLYWQQTNSSVVISNRVHTVIQSALLRPNNTNSLDSMPGPETGALLIDSERFNYDGPSGNCLWSGSARVTGTNFLLRSAVLHANVPEGTRQVNSLLAETNVVLDYGELHATGGRLSYAPESGLIRMTEQAAWQAKQREGNGDELVIDRSNHVFQVNHHARLMLSGQALGESGFLSFSNTVPAAHATNRSVLILASQYAIRTNLAVFHDNVVLEERLNGKVRGKMTSQDMTAAFAGTNELQTLTATQHVVIEEGEKSFKGGRAVYTHTNSTLEMTEHPEWSDGRNKGRGDLLRLNTQKGEMLVSGNAWLRMPASQLGAQLLAGTGATNRVAKAATNQFAEIFSQSYILRTNDSVFKGGVYATHPDMNWSCETLTVQVQSSGVTNVLVQQNVAFDVNTQKGPVHGKGDNARYSFGMMNTATNGAKPIDELQLEGSPARVWGLDWTNQNPVIIWDRLRNKLTLPGSEYRLQGVAKAIDTNIFVLPKKKQTK